MAEVSYGRFWRHLEGIFEVERMGPHGAGHLGIGGKQSTTPSNMPPAPQELNQGKIGTLSDVYASPGVKLPYPPPLDLLLI